jgi:hypothetical protein
MEDSQQPPSSDDAEGSPSIPNRPRLSTLFTLATGLWLLLVTAGFAWFERYSREPGEAGESPTHWPADSRLPHATDQPTLLFFAHPQCPCTRASLAELARVLARCPGKVNPIVVFLRYQRFDEQWTHGDLWREAGAIPGVKVLADDGKEAGRFGAVTSGHVLLYDAQGLRQFSGGITPSRGQTGENPGSDALLARLEGQTTTGQALRATAARAAKKVEKLAKATAQRDSRWN